MDTNTGQAGQTEQAGRADTPQGIKSISTMVTDRFVAIAAKFKVTPEFLLSLAARDFVDSEPKALNVLSASPLNEQDCQKCPAQKHCSSAQSRARERLICFERLVPVMLAGIAGLMLELIDRLV